VEGDTTSANLGKFGCQLCRGVDGVLGLAAPQIDGAALLVVGQDRLSDRRAVRRLASAYTGGDRRGHTVADLLQVHDVGAVQDSQVHDQPGGAVKIVQQWHRGAMKPVLVYGKRSEFYQAPAEFAIPAVAAQ